MRRRAADELFARTIELEELFAAADRPSEPLAREHAEIAVALAWSREALELPDYDPAILFETSREIARETGVAWLRIMCTTSLAQVLTNRAEYGRAEDMLLEDLADLAGNSSARMADLHIKVVQLARAQGRFEDALAHLAEIDALLARLDPNDLETRLARVDYLGTLAELELGLGNPDRAMPLVLEELVLAEGLAYPGYVERALDHRAMTLVAQGRMDATRRFVDQTLAREGLFANPVRRAALRARAALALAIQAQYDLDLASDAEGELRALLADAALADDVAHRVRASLAAVLQAAGRLAEAGDEIARLQAIRDEFRLDDDVMLAALAHRQCRLTACSQTKPARRQLFGTWRRFSASWRATPSRPGGIGFLNYLGRRMILSELIRAALAEEPGEAGIARALEFVLEAEALGSFARSAGYEPRPFARIRARLAVPGTGVLVVLPGATETHLFAFDDEVLLHETLPYLARFRELRQEWLQRLVRKPSSRDAGPGARAELLDNSAARQLTELLLPESVRERLQGWDTVLVDGQEMLGYTPFEFLPLDGAFLGDALAISYLPSLPVAMILDERPDVSEPAAEELVLVAAPDFAQYGETYAPIPVDGVLERLTSGFASNEVSSYVGARARAEVLRSAEVKTARLLHLFTHGDELPELVRSAALVLAGEPGLVDSAWIEANVQAPAVVLVSACGAGRGVTRRGNDGPANLGGALLKAGAKVVVISPNQLEVESQSRLVEVLQARLRAGDTVAEALRAARAALARDPATSHPYFSLVHAVGLGTTRAYPRAK